MPDLVDAMGAVFFPGLDRILILLIKALGSIQGFQGFKSKVGLGTFMLFPYPDTCPRYCNNPSLLQITGMAFNHFRKKILSLYEWNVWQPDDAAMRFAFGNGQFTMSTVIIIRFSSTAQLITSSSDMV